MRIGLVLHQFPSLEHPYIFDWVKDMLEKDIELRIITEKLSEPQSSKFWKMDKNLSSKIIQINFINELNLILFLKTSLIALFHPGKLWQLIKTLKLSESMNFRSLLRKLVEYLPLLNYEFDLIHFNAPQIAIRRFELVNYFQAKSLVSFRGQDFSFYPDRYRPLLTKSDHLHFISNHLVELALENGYQGGKHSVIPPMINTEFYCPSKTENQKVSPPYILFTAARLEWVKGYEFALQAVAILLQKGIDIEYYIAGDGEFKDAVVYTIHQLGIHDHVHLLVWQTPEETREWMQKSDIYILASVNEAFNNSVLQAQACGLAVVCSDAGGLPENIIDGVTGFLFKRRNALDMANKIEALLVNYELRIKFGTNAREHVIQKFSINEKTSEFLDLYKKLHENIIYM